MMDSRAIQYLVGPKTLGTNSEIACLVQSWCKVDLGLKHMGFWVDIESTLWAANLGPYLCLACLCGIRGMGSCLVSGWLSKLWSLFGSLV